MQNMLKFAKDLRKVPLQAVKRVLHYIQGTKNNKLRIKNKKSHLSLSFYASWCITQDLKSFGGYITKIGELLFG